MHKDQDYVVKDDEILIVDEFTGRIMPGRRYSDGLHQAIEAKEHVKIKREKMCIRDSPAGASLSKHFATLVWLPRPTANSATRTGIPRITRKHK